MNKVEYYIKKYLSDLKWNYDEVLEAYVFRSKKKVDVDLFLQKLGLNKDSIQYLDDIDDDHGFAIGKLDKPPITALKLIDFKYTDSYCNNEIIIQIADNICKIRASRYNNHWEVKSKNERVIKHIREIKRLLEKELSDYKCENNCNNCG